MLNPKICRKCRFRGEECIQEDIDGCTWETACFLACSGLQNLRLEDEPPKDCPFWLEHVLSMQFVPEGVASRMSGAAYAFAEDM